MWSEPAPERESSGAPSMARTRTPACSPSMRTRLRFSRRVLRPTLAATDAVVTGLVTGTAVRVAAVDGTELHQPGAVSQVALRVPAGGRYDVTFEMPAGAVSVRPADSGEVGLLLAPPSGSGGAGPVAAGDDTGSWPVLDLLRYGTPTATPFGADSAFDRRFTLVLDRGIGLVNGRPAYAYTVNGHAFPRIATEYVRAGDLVSMTVVNRDRDTHPWHLHGHRVLVQSRDGVAPSGSPLWLDTFDVRPGEVWQVAFRADNPGLWMNHCHNLSHADQGMALHLAYAGVESAFHGAHGG